MHVESFSDVVAATVEALVLAAIAGAVVLAAILVGGVAAAIVATVGSIATIELVSCVPSTWVVPWARRRLMSSFGMLGIYSENKIGKKNNNKLFRKSVLLGSTKQSKKQCED
jgi:hypothetical protein